MPPPPQAIPEVFDLMSPSGRLRRVYAEAMVPRLLEKAAASTRARCGLFTTPAGFSGTLEESNEVGRVLVGAGASFDFRDSVTKSEIEAHSSFVTGLPRQLCARIINVLEDSARVLFRGRHGASLGFIGMLPVVQANRPQPRLGLVIDHCAPEPQLRASAMRGAIDMLEPWALGAGDYLKVHLPATLLARPEGADDAGPISSRYIKYLIHGSLLPEGPQIAYQTGYGASPPSEITNGRWFLSGKQGKRKDPIDESDISPHPVIFIGRLAQPGPRARFRVPCLDLVLLTVNPLQDGAIDFIGMQSMSAVLSTVLRWELWSVFLAWSGDRNFKVIDWDDPTGVLDLSVDTKKDRSHRNVRDGATQDQGKRRASYLQGMFDKLATIREAMDTEGIAHRRELLEVIRSLDSAKLHDIAHQRRLVSEINERLVRLGVHFQCPTCRVPSVLLMSNPRPESRFRGGISAQHISPEDRNKHVPTSWREVPGFVSRRTATESENATQPTPQP